VTEAPSVPEAFVEQDAAVVEMEEALTVPEAPLSESEALTVTEAPSSVPEAFDEQVLSTLEQDTAVVEMKELVSEASSTMEQVSSLVVEQALTVEQVEDDASSAPQSFECVSMVRCLPPPLESDLEVPNFSPPSSPVASVTAPLSPLPSPLQELVDSQAFYNEKHNLNEFKLDIMVDDSLEMDLGVFHTPPTLEAELGVVVGYCDGFKVFMADGFRLNCAFLLTLKWIDGKLYAVCNKPFESYPSFNTVVKLFVPPAVTDETVTSEVLAVVLFYLLRVKFRSYGLYNHLINHEFQELSLDTINKFCSKEFMELLKSYTHLLFEAFEKVAASM
jgi:hypothetical protein